VVQQLKWAVETSRMGSGRTVPHLYLMPHLLLVAQYKFCFTVHYLRLTLSLQEWSEKQENGVRLRSRLHPCLHCILGLLHAVPACCDLYISALASSFEEDPDASSLTVQIIMAAVSEGKQQTSLWGTPVTTSMAARIAENACSSVFIVKTAISPATARRLHELFAGLSKDIFTSKTFLSTTVAYT